MSTSVSRILNILIVIDIFYKEHAIIVMIMLCIFILGDRCTIRRHRKPWVQDTERRQTKQKTIQTDKTKKTIEHKYIRNSSILFNYSILCMIWYMFLLPGRLVILLYYWNTFIEF
jgi:hypothetical protein